MGIIMKVLTEVKFVFGHIILIENQKKIFTNLMNMYFVYLENM